MTNKNNYTAGLAYVVSGLENTYGLLKEVKGNTLTSFDILDVIKCVNTSVASLNKEDLHRKNTNAGKYVALLSYTSERLYFYSKANLDYSNYEHLNQVSKVLLNFIDKDKITKESINSVNTIIWVLSKIDKQYLQFRFALGYRFLRIFVVLILHGSYFNASIVASFILKQIVIGGKNGNT